MTANARYVTRDGVNWASMSCFATVHTVHPLTGWTSLHFFFKP